VRRLKVALIFGGRSAEHEVSLRSARSIASALDPERYEVVPVAIDRKGVWQIADGAVKYLENSTSEEVAHTSGALVPAFSAENCPFDLAFPIVHGPYGEDGTLQGLLKLANVPFVGPSVLGSAVGMDKDVTKRLLREAGIPVPKFKVFSSVREINPEQCFSELGQTLFVKPANMGSSVGISRVKSVAALEAAVALAFQFDCKILVEEGVAAREIEVSVLGNSDPQASVPGEIRPKGGFYDYENKYISDDGAELLIPAPLTSAEVSRCQELAVRTFKVLCCEGMSRVDLFLTATGELMVNEINTLPGFTSISMYPKLWEASGLSFRNLLDRLIELAIERFNRESRYLVKPDAN
jgi:D-alanine-D-alanine ligase